MTETEKAITLESIEFWKRQQHNRKIKKHFENLGYKVEVIKLPYSLNIGESFLNGKEYIKIGYNFINTRKAYCIACEIPEFNIEEQNSELEIDMEDEELTHYYYQEGDYEIKTVKSILKDIILPIRQFYWWAEIKYLYPLQRKIKLAKIKASRKKIISL